MHQADPLNAESPRAALAQEPLTPTDTFYVRSHGPLPAADQLAWRLGVEGLVNRTLELSLGDLRERFRHQCVTATLQCAGNRRAGLLEVQEIPGEAPWGPGATGTAQWCGARLADVLAEAGVDERARYVELVGADVSPEAHPPQPFGGSIPLRKAASAEVLLAWSMNGEPLPALHGAPLRAVVPGYIGARSVKWLTRIAVRDAPSENFFQSTAYRLVPAGTAPGAGVGVALGAVAVNCDFLSPAEHAGVPEGPVALTGYAFAGDDRHVVRVDVSADGGGSWRQAQLLDAPSPWAWRRWRIELELSGAGEREIVARAWDSAAATQPADPAQLWNPKGYVNNSWARLRLRVL